MVFQQLVIIITSCYVVLPQNIEVRNAYLMNIRDGITTSQYVSHPEPAYAGYTFDVTKTTSRNNSVSILIGQPREGKVNATTSAGKILNCKVAFDAATSGSVSESSGESTEIQGKPDITPAYCAGAIERSSIAFILTAFEGKGLSQDLTGSKYVEANCTTEKIFDSTDRTQIGAFHEYTSDALGLNLGKIGDAGNYAVCAQGRQKECPGGDSAASSPGACYFGNPDTKWKFLQRNESKCFDNTIDIIFLVDGSSSIGKVNFTIVKNWLVEAIKLIEVFYGDAVRTEVIQYSRKPLEFWGIPITDDSYFVIPYTLKDALSIDEMERRIQDMSYTGKTTYTYYGLRRAVEVDFRRSTQYPNSKRVLVVLTDGEADDWSSLKQLWWDKYGKTKWCIPFAIGVGEKYGRFMDQLKTIANGNKNGMDRVLTVDRFDQLPKLLSELTNSIATAVVSEGQATSSAVRTAASSTNNRQMGSSITALKDGSIHFGSVGMYLDSGSVMRYDNQSDTYPDVPSFATVQQALPNTTTDSYLGYTTVSGYFNGQSQGQYIAAGAPRYKLKGAIVLYKPMNSSAYMKDSFTIFPPNNARDQVAAYFGGCLLSVDVNSDGLDDLFVASPLFVGENYDEGRVSVYIGQRSDSITQWTQRSFLPIDLFGDRSNGARFGSAMAAAGDLNIDGFQDVVIGAPTADGGRGAVFIYHGMSGGISPKYTQRILASSLTGATLQYFGQSLVGGIDVDDNGYPDIFVGSPKTDSIVMLKSRPIVRLWSSMRYLNSTIHFMTCVTSKSYENCAALQVCFSANGTAVEDMISIVYTLTLDSTKGRAVFNSSSTKTISETFAIPKETWQCFNYSVNILRNASDFNTPVAAKVEFRLNESHTDVPMSSITDPTSQNSNTADINWEKECVLGVCTPDLFVTGRGAEDPNLPTIITIASSTENTPLAMTVSLGNTGEPSFYTKLRITYPASTTITTIKGKCVEELGPPVIANGKAVQLYKYIGEEREGMQSSNSQCSFPVSVALRSLREESSLESFFFTVYVFTDSSTSFEDYSTLQNNTWKISIPIDDIGDTAITFNDTRNDTSDIKSIEQIGVNTSDVEVDIRITPSGYSNIPLAEVTFTYPWLIDHTFPVLYLYKLECPTHSGKALCTCNTSFVDKYGLSNNATVSSVDQSGSGDVGVKAPSMDEFLDEDMICPKTDVSSNYSCAIIPCTISNLYTSGEVHFKASFRLWTRSLNGMFDNPNITSLAIKSNFRMSTEISPLIIGEDGESIPARHQEVVVIATKFVKEVVVVNQQNSWLYIALGIAGGVLFLALVAFGLWKCGFFKNQYREKLDDQLDDETDFTDEERASKPKYTDDQQDQMESTGSAPYTFDIASNQIDTMTGNSNENTNHDYTNDPIATEARALQALQSVTDDNDSEPDYDEPPDDAFDDDDMEDTLMASAVQTVTNEYSDDEPDYDLPPDADILPPPPDL